MALRFKTATIVLGLFFLTGTLTAQSRPGRSLPLPDSAKGIIAAVGDQCPDCLAAGFVPTGTDKIGFGKNFYPNFFLGNPPVGILIHQVPTKAAYNDLLRNPDYIVLKETLAGLFSKTRLVLIEKECGVVHVTGSPDSITVTLTQKLHQCLASSGKPLCCCCTAGCETECCEKSLGSTYATVQWKDPLKPGHMIEYRYFLHPGDSKLLRLDETGRKTELRWCLDFDGTGSLL